MEKCHILNFISVDCILNSEMNKESINFKLLDAELLKE